MLIDFIFVATLLVNYGLFYRFIKWCDYQISPKQIDE